MLEKEFNLKLKEERLDLKTSIKDDLDKEYEAKIDKVKMEWMERNQALKSQVEALQTDIKQRKSLIDQNPQIRNSVKPFDNDSQLAKENEKLTAVLKEKEALIE